MEAPIELSHNVEELLRGRPRLVTHFLARRLACPGCPMACFETLGDVARNYGLAAEVFLAEVRASAASTD